MAFTTYQTTVAEIAQAAYGRALASSGLDFYAQHLEAGNYTEASLFDEFLTNNEAAIRYPATQSHEDTVNQVFNNVLNRDVATQEGLDFYTARLEAGLTLAELVNEVLSDAKSGGGDQAYLDSKVAEAEAAYTPSAEAGATYTLTNGSDAATANIFNADMVYTPDGSDRILSLQDEDELTGEAGRTDNTLNVEIGNRNADEGTTATVTPTLNNIQKLNIDWTGNTTTMDLRYSDSVDSIYINKITQDANAVILNNITTIASDLKVKDVYDNTSSQTFTYVRGVLDDDADAMDLELSDVLTSSITVQSGGGANEGFETVSLTVSEGVDVDTLFSVEDMENLVITGSGFLDILNQVWTANEYNAFTAAIANPGSVGLRTIDMSNFIGDSNIDISANLGRNVDVDNSGAPFYGVTTGGTGDDTFHTNAAVAALATDSVQNVIDGGSGNNTLVSYSGGIVGVAGAAGDSQNVAVIKNIQNLELRDQGAMAAVDMDAFDSELTSIFMRDEDFDGAASTFTLNDMTADQAASSMTLAHGITDGAIINSVVNANLKDATGADDTMAINIVNDLNTGTTFNYTLAFAGADTDGILATVNTGVAATSDADAVENVTINDNDTESNIVTLTNIINHTGTTTLTGGSDGKTFTVADTLNSSEIDASTQVSDVRLTIGDTVGTITTITQDVKLGEGDDVLTFANIDELDATDSLTDAGGNDTVRAAFSKDSTLDIAGIENLHVTATANVTLGMAAAEVTNLVLLANSAVGGGADLDKNGVANINIAGASLAANVITLDQSTLTELNFFGDADNNDIVIAGADDVVAHTFNGVTLTNNTATDITVNINTSLDVVNTGTAAGALSYTTGQITTHGNTGMNIVVGNERANAGTTTTINNIYAKNMTTLTADADGNLALGTVSGAPLNNSLKTFDMSNVKGVVTANVISLGDNAVVTLADANNVVSALGSAGKDVVMTAGNGNNTIVGTAQDDTITTGTGRDTVSGDRGDNVVNTGAGNDTVTTKDGSDTVDLGTGIDRYVDNLLTGIDASLANNTVSMSGGIATVAIDVDGAVAGKAVDQHLAVGLGSDLTISWVGEVMSTNTATLNGTVMSAADLAAANAIGAAAIAGTAGSDLQIFTGANSVVAAVGTAGAATAVKTFTGGNGDDVVIWTGSAAATSDGLDFTGGAGNDAAVGTINQDIFTGGTGADMIVMADVAAFDAVTDQVVIADGDSTASAWDQILGFDTVTAANVSPVVAIGGTVAGSDVLDLDTTLIIADTAGVATAIVAAQQITSNDGVTAVVDGYQVDAADTGLGVNGVVTFEDGGLAVAVGTGAGQISLANALAFLSTELNGTGRTAVFEYDLTGDGSTADDSTFVFQDGVNDTVVELVGVTGVLGVELAGVGIANYLDIV